MNPFDFINDITYNKNNVMTEDNEKDYVPFVVNRGLSYFIDTVFQANEMNANHSLDHHLQFDYLLNSIRKKRRFSKWNKKQDLQVLEAIQEYYGYSISKAKDVVSILNDDQIESIKNYKGGVNES